MKTISRNIFAMLFIVCMICIQCGSVFAIDESSTNTSSTASFEPTINSLRKDLNTLISYGVTAEWAPDVTANSGTISRMVDNFKTLPTAQKSEFSEDELASLKAYFKTYYKVANLDSTELDVMFNLEIEDEIPVSFPTASEPESSLPTSSMSTLSSTRESSLPPSSAPPSSAELSSEPSSMVDSSMLASSISASSEDESEPIIAAVSSDLGTSSESDQVVIASISDEGFDTATIILLAGIIVVAIALLIAIKLVFFSKKIQSDDSMLNGNDSWFIEYIKNSTAKSEDNEFESALKAVKSMLLNDKNKIGHNDNIDYLSKAGRNIENTKVDKKDNPDKPDIGNHFDFTV